MEAVVTRSAMQRCSAALVLVTALGGVPFAHAQMKGNFDDADVNHDGRVTLQEFETYAASHLAAANGPRAQRFKQLDPQLQAAVLQKRFDARDRRHKGYLDRSDWNGP